MAKIIALSCTQRRQMSLTDAYLDHAAAGYRAEDKEAEISFIRLIDYRLNVCTANDECLRTGRCPLPDQFYDIIAEATGAGGLIICMPVHGGNMPAILKIFIERLKTFMNQEERPFGGLAVGTIVHSRAMFTEAALGALSPWFQRLNNRHVTSVGLTKVGKGDVEDTFNPLLCQTLGKQLAVHLSRSARPFQAGDDQKC